MTSSTEALNAEIERQESLVTVYRGAQLRAEEKLRRAEADTKGWKLRAERLEAKLATARREGMEAAAVIAENCGYMLDIEECMNMTKKQHGERACHEVAAAIRAQMETEK